MKTLLSLPLGDLDCCVLERLGCSSMSDRDVWLKQVAERAA